PENHASDPVIARLIRILDGRIGRSAGDQEVLVREARRRLDAKVPPGYLDAKKTDARAIGDCLVWLQTLAESRRRGNKLLVLVTDDVKEDWWRLEKGQVRGPRPELVLEAQRDHGAVLHLMRLPTLLH